MSTAIETVFILPRNQFYVSYRINEGANHIIKKDDAFEYFKQFISNKNVRPLIDALDRFQPILILVSTDEVIELKKEINDFDYYRDVLKDEIFNQVNRGGQSITKKEVIPNDKKLQGFMKKVLT